MMMMAGGSASLSSSSSSSSSSHNEIILNSIFQNDNANLNLNNTLGMGVVADMVNSCSVGMTAANKNPNALVYSFNNYYFAETSQDPDNLDTQI